MPIGTVRYLKRHWRLLLFILAAVYIYLVKKSSKKIYYMTDSITMDAYSSEYERSITDNGSYWKSKALEYLTWSKPFTKTYSGYHQIILYIHVFNFVIESFQRASQNGSRMVDSMWRTIVWIAMPVRIQKRLL